MSEQLTDQQIVERVQSGDKNAFGLLVTKYQHKVANLVSRYVKNSGDVADVTQEAFIKTYRALASFRGESAFYTWLYRIAHNRLIDQFRRDAANPVTTDNDTEARSHSSPEDQHSNQQLQQALQNAVQQLPVEQRSAFLLRQERGKSLEDIAEVMGVGRETVKSRLRYAVGRLREELGDTWQEYQPGGTHG